jgi:hypothetical protein
MSDPYHFSVLFEIIDNDLDARLDMPENFLLEEPKRQVNLIHGLREQFRTMDLGDLQLTSSYDTVKSKSLLISSYAHLFPLTSLINVEFDSSAEAYSIALKHDKNMSAIPQTLQPIFVALVIASLTSAGILIVASNEGLIK